MSYVSAEAVSLGPDTSLCKGQSLTLTANVPSATYLWSTASVNNSIAVNTNGDYWVKVSNGVCTVADTINVLFRDPPAISLGNDTALCDKERLLLSVSVPKSLYQWQDGSAKDNYEVATSGTYWVVVNQQGCIAADTIQVSYKPIPALYLGNDTLLCENENLLLNTYNSAIQSYRWQDGTTDSSYNIHTQGAY